MNLEPEIFICETDYDQLNSFLSRQASNQDIHLLMAELDRAEIIPTNEMPDNVVRMYSEVTFTVSTTGKTFSAQLVYPNEVSSRDTISILSPVGSALLGLSVGQSIEWPLSIDRRTLVKIENVNNSHIDK
ncbi:nucleoside diphosphate kinase regulator [Saccharophagus degradans]|uniref:Nucleoside diphosphate kinase regulator n=1 Tax=Saccharophagus degradans TaxID=86304 RepID=A0AAW7X4D7_9GAMM|nr:nucleoside diphosphate kinase regulator [Saccharophagus degradans]MBU2985613.1 nucleoside diphosphate kinase regulator [Saccharophagus degradans]MDO6421249.1 nucleoside diphosphate kinase regulator [Saccharophagus degradans]MDO6605840.1 nucleoside diphosphate kinase regulator [Saccharophagus degradans]